MEPPTVKLPPIKAISETPSETLLDSLIYIRKIYSPEIRGSRRRKPTNYPDLEPSTQSELWVVRVDAFERVYVVRWLTALISKTPDESLVDTAAAILALCAGPAAAGSLTRKLSFSCSSLGKEIEVALSDLPLENGAYSSVGAQTWGGACVLAEGILAAPANYGLPVPGPMISTDAPSDQLRILELGAGTGLVSLIVTKYLSNVMVSENLPFPRSFVVVATDFYPPVLANLQANIKANGCPISVLPLDWEAFAAGRRAPPMSELEGPFDIVYGADIVYEAQHARWIKTCLYRLLRRLPSSGFFHLVIPLRSTHTNESRTIEETFPLAKDAVSADLGIYSKEVIECDAEGGVVGGDVVEYAYYKIGWTLEKLR